MLKVVNISDQYSKSGIQKYQLYINDIPLTQFEHFSEDGMAKCLERAAESLEGFDVDKKIRNHQTDNLFNKILADLLFSYEHSKRL